MMQPSSTTFAEPPVGSDGLIDVFALATRVAGSPEIRPSNVDLAALDRDTPAAPSSPFVQMAQQAAPEPAVDHQLLVNEVAAEQPTGPGLPDGAVRVDLRDAKGDNVIGTFVVLGGDDWPSEANPWMQDPMKWHEWAMTVLATDDDRDLWKALRPTNRQTSAFITAFLTATGALPAPKGRR